MRTGLNLERGGAAGERRRGRPNRERRRGRPDGERRRGRPNGSSTLPGMCVQCTVGAASAATAATGMRAYLATRTWSWLTERALGRITAVLVGTGIVASGVLLS